MSQGEHPTSWTWEARCVGGLLVAHIVDSVGTESANCLDDVDAESRDSLDDVDAESRDSLDCVDAESLDCVSVMYMRCRQCGGYLRQGIFHM